MMPQLAARGTPVRDGGAAHGQVSLAFRQAGAYVTHYRLNAEQAATLRAELGRAVEGITSSETGQGRHVVPRSVGVAHTLHIGRRGNPAVVPAGPETAGTPAPWGDCSPLVDQWLRAAAPAFHASLVQRARTAVCVRPVSSASSRIERPAT